MNPGRSCRFAINFLLILAMRTGLPAAEPAPLIPMPLVDPAPFDGGLSGIDGRLSGTDPLHESVSDELTAEQLDAIDQRVGALLGKQPNLKPGLQFGYQNGFTIASPSGVKIANAPFSMRINSWFQFRHTVFESRTSNEDQNDLEFERLRLTFQGNVYTPDLKYFIQFDGDSDQAEVSDWLDYYIRYDFGHVCGLEAGRLGLRLGKWKLPYNRSRFEAGWKLAFTDRATASVFFDINRSQAVALYGKFGLLGRTVNWESAISNGFKTGGLRPVRRGEVDRNFGISTRLWGDWLGEWGSDGESDLSYHDRLAMRVGGGFACTRLNPTTLESLRLRVVDSGEILDTILPASVNQYDLCYYAVDANWKYRGGSVLSEYYFRTLRDFRGAAVSNLFDHGFLLQAGKFVIHKKLELLVRWSRIVGDSGTLGAMEQSSDEIAGGLVWFFNGQRAKFTFDATHLNGAPIRDLTLNILPGDDGMLYRSQFQLVF